MNDDRTKTVCAPRASKHYPHVFNKDELIAKAHEELNLPMSFLRRLSKEDLCKRLQLPFVNKATLDELRNKGKVCSRDNKYPLRYTRKELETLGLLKGFSASQVKTFSYDELCKHLHLSTPSIKSNNTTAIDTTEKDNGNCIERSFKPLKHHQEAVLRYLDTHRGLIVFHKVGSGKTLTAVAASQCFLDAHPQGRVTVITPAGLLANFKDEMLHSYRHLKHSNRYDFYSYQKFVRESKQKKIHCKDHMVIIDEGHNLRTPYSLTVSTKSKSHEKGVNTLHVTNCTREASKVLILTGTPVYNSPRDIFTLYNMISAEKIQLNAPVEILEKMLEKQILPNAEVDTVFPLLRCKISFHDTHGNPNFPSKEEVYEYIDMSPEYQRKYKQLVSIITKKAKDNDDVVSNMFGQKNLTSFYNALRRGVNNLDNSNKNRKLQWVIHKLSHLKKNEKTLVFSNFLSAGIHLITKQLPPTVRYAVIEGKVSASRRKQIKEDFNTGKIQVLFLSKAGGEGLDLKGTRNVIIMEPTWNQASLEQVIGRAIRYKSHAELQDPRDRHVKIYFLVHLLSDDRPAIAPMEDYLKRLQKDKKEESMTESAPVSPYVNSIDLFLYFALREKQVQLDHYNKMLKSYSIEENECP